MENNEKEYYEKVDIDNELKQKRGGISLWRTRDF